MDAIVQGIAKAMNDSLGAPLAVFLLSVIPIAEARFAIPFGISMGLSPGEAFGWAFLGSSLMAPILVLVFLPIINALSKTKFFSKLGKFLYEKFEKKSRSLSQTVNDKDGVTQSQNPHKLTKTEIKKIGGTALFVAIPLPLTGVWTGSAVASILKIGFLKSVIGVIIGNAAACGIITLISFLFKDYVNYITLAFFVIAVLVVVALIVKLVIYKPKTANTADAEQHKDENTSTNEQDGNF